MIHFNFIASNTFDLDDLNSIESFVNSFPDFQPVFLNNEGELKLLFELLEIDYSSIDYIENSEFTKYWNISNSKLPEFNQAQFDLFYQKWIDKSSRNNNMDEYGSLLFLQGLSKTWNKLNHRFVVREN